MYNNGKQGKSKRTRKRQAAAKHVVKGLGGKKRVQGGKTIETKKTMVKPVTLPKFKSGGTIEQVSDVAVPKKEYKKLAKEKFGKKEAKERFQKAKKQGRVIEKITYSTKGFGRRKRLK